MSVKQILFKNMLQEEGILDQISRNYLKKTKRPCGNHGTNISHSDMLETISAFVLLGVCHGIALVILTIEWLSRREKK